MDYNLINEKKRHILLNPSKDNVEDLLKASSNLAPNSSDEDVALLASILLMGNWKRNNVQHLTHINGNARNGNQTEATEIIGTCDLDPIPFCLRIPANAQWSPVNGLGDIEWIQNECVRPCLEDKIFHGQVLPSPRKFTVMITGKFQNLPNPSISVPFHSLNYKAYLVSKSEKSNWTNHRYECVLPHNERLEIAYEDILYELVFDTTAGDYVLEISYFI